MTLLLKLLDKLGRKRVIMDRVHDEPYLERYYLFLKERDNFPFNIFLHKFLKGDPDDVHDHPWGYCQLGGYRFLSDTALCQTKSAFGMNTASCVVV